MGYCGRCDGAGVVCVICRVPSFECGCGTFRPTACPDCDGTGDGEIDTDLEGDAYEPDLWDDWNNRGSD